MASAGIVLIVAGAFLLHRSNVFPGPAAVIPVAGAALVIIFGSSLLRHKWIVSIGLISYPLYLWHWPLLSFALIAGLTSPAAKLAAVALSLVLAALTTAFIERPIRFGSLRAWSVPLSLGAVLATVVVSTAIWQDNGVYWRFPEQIRPVLAVMEYKPATGARVGKCWLDAKSGFESYSSECGAGSTLIWGDSHAARLYAGLRQGGDEIAQFTRDGCAPGVVSQGEVCTASNRAILARIAELKPKRVILFAVWTSHKEYNELNSGDAENSDFVALLRQLRSEVGEVIVIGTPPLWAPDLPTQVYDFWRSNGRLPDRLPPRVENYQSVDGALARMSAASGARFISAYATLCNQDGCLTHAIASKADLLSWDYGHLTLAGAQFLGKLLHIE